MSKQTEHRTTPKEMENLAREKWFDQFMLKMNEQIKHDRFCIQEGIADEQTKRMYKNFQEGNSYNLANELIPKLSQEIFMQLIRDFLKDLLIDRGAEPLHLALHPSSNKIYGWAVVKDDDWEVEKAIYLATAKANAKHVESPFRIDFTIVEEGDNIPVPPQYQTVEY